jgi:flagellar hook-associated protein 2
MSDPSNISSQIMTTLGVGSGMDVFKLAQDLTDVEKIPKQEAIESEITATEASISGYALVSYQIGLLQTAFEQLNDLSELKSSSGASANESLINFTSVDGSASAGGYDIEVSQLAQEQRVISDQYSATTASLNGSAFDLSITVGNTSTTNSTVTVSTPTPAGVVAAINAASTGVTASLIDTGTSGANYRIVLSGPTGSEGAFTISSTPDLGFSDGGNTLQSAQDANLTFEGLSLTRSSNELSDVIEGTTLSIKGTTSSAVRLTISDDKSVLKTNIENVVTTYNDLNTILNQLATPGATTELGGALAGDTSLVRYVKDQIRTAVLADSSTSSGSMDALRDIGVSIDRTGELTFDETTYDSVIASSFDDVAMMLSANTDNQSLYTSDSKGLAQDIVTTLEGLIDSDGIVTTRTENAEDTLDDYRDELVKLEARMEGVYQRYLSQFTAMESLMASLDTTKNYLEGQLESLANFYKND